MAINVTGRAAQKLACKLLALLAKQLNSLYLSIETTAVRGILNRASHSILGAPVEKPCIESFVSRIPLMRFEALQY
jgi:hypothetical protein